MVHVGIHHRKVVFMNEQALDFVRIAHFVWDLKALPDVTAKYEAYKEKQAAGVREWCECEVMPRLAEMRHQIEQEKAGLVSVSHSG